MKSLNFTLATHPLCVLSPMSSNMLGLQLRRGEPEWYGAPGGRACSQPWTFFWDFAYWPLDGHPRHCCLLFSVQWGRWMSVLLGNLTQLLCHSCFEAKKSQSCGSRQDWSLWPRGFSSKPETSSCSRGLWQGMLSSYFVRLLHWPEMQGSGRIKTGIFTASFLSSQRHWAHLLF